MRERNRFKLFEFLMSVLAGFLILAPIVFVGFAMYAVAHFILKFW